MVEYNVHYNRQDEIEMSMRLMKSGNIKYSLTYK